MKVSGRRFEGGECEVSGAGWQGREAHCWEKLECVPKSLQNSTSVPSGKETMGGEAATTATLFCHFGGKANGAGKHLLRTPEAQGGNNCKVTKGWGLSVLRPGCAVHTHGLQARCLQ